MRETRKWAVAAASCALAAFAVTEPSRPAPAAAASPAASATHSETRTGAPPAPLWFGDDARPAESRPGTTGRAATTDAPDAPDASGDVPDRVRGRHVEHGWFTCLPGNVPAAVGGLPEGLSFGAEVQHREYDAGAPIPVRVYLTNLTDRPVDLSATGWAGLLEPDGTPRSFRFGYDVPPAQPSYTVAPYEYVAVDVDVYPWTCGEVLSRSHAGPGAYDVVATLDWTLPSGQRGRWVAPPLRVRLVAGGAPQPTSGDWHAVDRRGRDVPCEADGTGCRTMYGETCLTEPPPSGDFGAGRGLRLAFTPDDAVARRGVTGTFTITNDSTRVRYLAVTPGRHSGWLSGPWGQRSPLGFNAAYHRYRIEPGRSVRLYGTVPATACVGSTPVLGHTATPVPPGEYQLTAGVYVTGYGWWFAPARTITLRAA